MRFNESKKKNNTKNEFSYNKENVPDMELTVENINAILGKSKDIKFREISISESRNIPATIIYIDGMVNISSISDYILKPIIQEKEFKEAKNPREVIKLIEDGYVYFSEQKTRFNINDCVNDILTGSLALVFNNAKTAITFSSKGFEERSITEPSGENVIKGSKDTFVENLRVNTATIRRKIKSPNLIMEETIVGKQTLTPVSIIYMDNITNIHIVDNVKKRLDSISVDNALSTSFIEEFIIDKKYSVFPQAIFTERPDKFCSNIVEGRVGIIIDGIPSVMIVPATLLQFMQAPEDYSQNFFFSSMVRLLRFILMTISLILPGFYISIASYHQEMIPTELALSIVASKEGVPFPSFIEVLFMLAAFEILVEAGLRLPKTIGQAVSIVGAVVVGQAAVNAKLVSPAVVVTIAITAIAGFTMPNYDLLNALRFWRFIIAIFSSIIGLFGLSLSVLFLLYHLCTINVLGVPYLSPFISTDGEQFQDTLFRFPISTFVKRPISLKSKNEKRQG